MMGENFVLVEMERGPGEPKIVRVIRVYDSIHRANEDLALLANTCPSSTFAVMPVEYVDR